MGIFGIAKRGFGMLGRKGKVGKTITGVKPKSTDIGKYKVRNLKGMGKSKRSLAETEAAAKETIKKAKDAGRRDLAVGSAKNLRKVKRAEKDADVFTKRILKTDR
jgi:hypothetical protein|tara:strand:- start:1647 stop:1961 length:315 start_codon:yes stop_codon:yes gene_type:complete